MQGDGRASRMSPMLLRIEFTASDSFQPMGELLPRLSTLTSSSQAPYPSPRRKAARLTHFAAPPLPHRTASLGSLRSLECASSMILRRAAKRHGALISLLNRCSIVEEEYDACGDEAVFLCCTFPEVAFGGRYPLSLPCGARTFLIRGDFSPRPRLSGPVARLL